MKRYFSIAVIVILVAGLTAGAYLAFVPQRSAASSTANLSTATVQRGTLTATVTGAGNVTSAQSVALNFQQSGTVQKVGAQVGDQVKAGQVLASLDTSALQLQLQNAQINLKIAQDKLAQAQNPSTAQDVANARAQLSAAQANYDKLVAGATTSDIAAARASVASAQAAYDAAVNSAGAAGTQLAAQAAAVQKAQVALQQAQAAYDRIASRPDVAMTSQALTLQQATIDYQSALASYQSLQATSQSDATSKVQSALAQLQQAQANLAKLQNQVTPNDITASKASVTQAQNNLDKLLAGPDAATLDIAQNGVDQAQIALQQIQLQLQQSQITAPFDGVVTAVNITPGQTATSSSSGAIQMADLSRLQIVLNMAEVDINKIQAGQTAQISFDALPNATFQGKVSQIAPAGVLTQGVVNYPVTIDLTGAVQNVKTGMTANVNVVVQQRTNVLMVPNRAVKTGVPTASGTPAASATRTGSQASGSGTTGQGSAAAGSQGARPSGSSGQGTTGQGARSGNQGASGTSGATGANGTTGTGGAGRTSRQQAKYVTVLSEGKLTEVPVVTGLSNDTMTEIVSGLNEGDVVVLSTTTTAAARTPSLGIPGLGGLGR